MSNKMITFEEYAKEVAKKLQINSVECLETIYGDLIRDCYDDGDTIDTCCHYCTSDELEELHNTYETIH